MSFLLDTCVISELVRPEPHAAVVAWLGEQDESGLYLSVITIGELEKGVAKLTASARRKALETWNRPQYSILMRPLCARASIPSPRARGRQCPPNKRPGRP